MGVKSRVGSNPTLGTILDFYKNFCYNIYIRIKERNKNYMEYWESFACEIQSDENWVETLIHMEDLNRLMQEDEVEEN